jgi:hypothetical protein
VSERNTTAWSLSATRIPDILADTFSVVVAQDFDGVAVEDGDYLALKLRDSGSRRGCQEREEHNEGLNRPSQQRARSFFRAAHPAMMGTTPAPLNRKQGVFV